MRIKRIHLNHLRIAETVKMQNPKLLNTTVIALKSTKLRQSKNLDELSI